MGIYVQYADATTNGADFWMVSLSNEIWKVVDGVPYLKKVTVTGTETTPNTPPVQVEGDLDGNVVDNTNTQYYIAWSGSDFYQYALFIKR